MEELLEEHGGVIISGIVSVMSIVMAIMIMYAMEFINMEMYCSLMGG